MYRILLIFIICYFKITISSELSDYGSGSKSTNFDGSGSGAETIFDGSGSGAESTINDGSGSTYYDGSGSVDIQTSIQRSHFNLNIIYLIIFFNNWLLDHFLLIELSLL